MSSSVAVIDYGMGNLHSVTKSLEHADPSVAVTVSADPKIIANADRIVFPGVGAIRDCMAEIKRLNIDSLVKQAITEKPVLAVCVGMQALMDHSEENNGINCMSVFSGEVKYFGNDLKDEQSEKLKVPHMGWNNVHQGGVSQNSSHPLWHNIKQDAYFYFVHSFCISANNQDDVAATCVYGHPFVAALTKPNLFAVQFHPEKSHNDGLQLYKNFLAWNGTY